jgi:hypothetical protein
LWGSAFEDISRDDVLFGQVRVDAEIGTISWPNGADLDPDLLHGDFEPARHSEHHQFIIGLMVDLDWRAIDDWLRRNVEKS